MASVYSNVNFTAYNKAQVRTAAKNLGIYHDNAETLATLTTKVKAK